VAHELLAQVLQLAVDPLVLVPCAAKIEGRLSRRVPAQFGHVGLADGRRTRISQSWPQSLQVNS